MRFNVPSKMTQHPRRKRTQISYVKQIAQLRKLLRHIAGIKEYSYAAGIAVTLTLRTICDLWMMKNGTLIEAAIITRDPSKLRFNMVSFILAMPTLAFVNCALKFFLQELKLSLRQNLSKLLYNKYISGLTYYRINVLDNTCPNVDQLLTNDVEKFSQALVDVYSNIAKPSLDIAILVQRMTLSYTGTATPGSGHRVLVTCRTGSDLCTKTTDSIDSETNSTRRSTSLCSLSIDCKL